MTELSFFPTKEQMMGNWTKTPVQVTTNHYSLSVQDDLRFTEWRISCIDAEDFEEYLNDPTEVQEAVPEDSKTLIFEIFKANSKEIKQKLGSSFTSGMRMFTIAKWEVEDVEWHFKGHSGYVMVCRCIQGGIELEQLSDMLDDSSQRRFIRYLNNSLQRMMRNQNYKEWDRTRGFFNINSKVNVDAHNLVVFNGFKSSFNTYERGVRLLFDSAVRIVKFSNMWDEFLNQEISSGNHEMVCDFFIGKTCMANYGNSRVYRIDDIDFMMSPLSPFPDKTYKNYEDYFMAKYKVPKLKHPEQFMLVHKSRVKSIAEDGKRSIRYEAVYLVPELMFPVGLTETVKDNSVLAADLSEYKFKKPQQRFGEINGLISSINEYKDEQAAFQLRINQNDNTITGYSLEYPRLKAGESMLNPEGKHLNVTELADGKKLTSWILVYDYKHENEHELVTENLRKAGVRYDLEIAKPLASLPLPKNATVEHVDQLIRKEKLNGKVSLVFFLVNRATARFLYKKAKAYYNSKGMLTQFFTSFNPQKDATGLTKYNNILLQMIVKLGGTIWEVESNKSDMIIAGADVYHHSPKTSVVSLVSQMGKNFNSYYSLAQRQNKGAMTMNSVYKMVIDTVKHYVKKHNKLPKQYLLFRRGVRKNEYDDLIEFEINRILENFQINYEEKAPKLIYVIVNTRVNDRFAVDTEQGLANPKGGLVIIDDVVEKEKANFYLISQVVQNGSACPTHYDIVYSNGDLKFEEIVDMAYAFTFGYSNWMGSLRVPSMIKNADKLSRQVGLAQTDDIKEELKESLFYL